MSAKTGIGDMSETMKEEDLRHRSSKKVKGGSHEFSNDSTRPLSYADVVDEMEVGDAAKKSYKETVLGIDAGSGSGGSKTVQTPIDGADADGIFHGMQLKIIEKTHGGHDCPEIVIPPHAEERLCRPWKQGLIVKLLGRRIGYKALENRLNQMWVEKGVMNIIDLGGEFFLVYLSSQEDYNHALTNGPWLIYDHYLTVREWRPNFRPEKEEINRVAVWVRLPELPVEYYDPDFLDFLGNRIGTTVKVDKTTQQMTRGKYARLCVEIDLNAPLLAMFEIKNHIYKIEYEGLHLLCMACGKFGHHKDHCANREEIDTPAGEVPVERRNENNDNNTRKTKDDGPWKVVQKQRLPRKGKDKGGLVTGGGRILPASINGKATKTGSRFDILETNEENIEEEREVPMEENLEPIIGNPILNMKKKEFNSASKSVKYAANNNGSHVQTIATFKETKQGPHAGKTGKKTSAGIAGTSADAIDTTSIAHHKHGPTLPPHAPQQHDHQLTIETPLPQMFNGPPKEMDLDTTKPIDIGPIQLHPTRPPDANGTITSHTSNSSNDLEGVGIMESEEFMDANEHGEPTASDAEMEVVTETPHF